MTSAKIRKVLLVDDDADDRKYFTKALAEIDNTIECIAVRNGEKAMELLSDNDVSIPDYIFLDMRMPRISGRQCLIQIRANERLKNIPVIIYTTSRQVEDSKDMESLGAVRFVSKPTDPDDIYYILSIVLEEQTNHAQP